MEIGYASVQQEDAVSALKRKTLIVDEESLKELARRRKKSESAVVRDAVAYALAAQDMDRGDRGPTETREH